MGRILQIRLSAYTFEPEEVKDTWPKLVKIALGVDRVYQDTLGVLELVNKLKDKVRYDESLDKNLKQVLLRYVERLEGVQNKLEQALADWLPAEANKLSYQLEDILDEAEKEVAKLV